MKKEIYIKEIGILVIIQSYKKSKSIKIFCKNGYIKVTKPIWYSNSNIIRYLKENKESIIKSYNQNLDIINCNNNILTQILYLGNVYKIITNFNNANDDVLFIENNLVLNVKENTLSNEDLKKIIKNFLINKSKEVINDRLRYVSNITNIKYTTYKIKDCKTMWGSCSSKGNLNFNYKLVMFPEHIIDQIILHELCHLKYLNHSNDFWNLVYTYCNIEKYKTGELWIKHNQKLLNII